MEIENAYTRINKFIGKKVPLVPPKLYKGEIMLESKIENKLKREVKRIGGWPLKFTSPGTNGVPDRILLMPGGKAIFVECKAPGEKPRKLQQERIKKLRSLGFKVEIVDSYKAIRKLIQEIGGGQE